MAKEIEMSEVQNHKSAESAWCVVDGSVYDVTEFLEEHPGGKKILLKNCGKDATDAFWNYHSEKVLTNVAAEYKIGEVKAGSKL